MDLSTTYLGLRLKHPLMPGACPLADDLDQVKALEDAGASAIVMRSLYQEQIEQERQGTIQALEEHAALSPEASSYFPAPSEHALGPASYLEQLRKVKEAVSVPVIGSLNGRNASGWLEYASLIEQAGADALELNVYHVATDAEETSQQVETRLLDIAKKVKGAVKIPVAVKLSPFFSAMACLAKDLDATGVDGLVLFNRFYQPDIDIDALEVVPQVHLSDSSELLLRLRWTAILSGRIKASLAVSGGVHEAADAIKAVMAGANAVQIVSAILRNGPRRLRDILEEMEKWLEAHEYESLEQMQGSMNLMRTPDPGAFERAQYMRVLQSWRP